MLWAYLGAQAQPPNNNIFFGGVGDGSFVGSYLVSAVNIFAGGIGDGSVNTSNNSTSNNIFVGGIGDGVSFVSNNAASNSIFLGGIGDGFSFESNNSISNNIFFGGSGDGFSFESNSSISNNIFLGGNGDGFSFESNNAVSNTIFFGGEGDGWSAVLFPLGPLPVSLLSFTAEESGKTHLVKWVTSSEINTNRFEVQRSQNGRDFISLGSTTPMGSASNGAAYSFTVALPLTGNNFYRLKMIDNDGTAAYSNIVLLKNSAGLQVSVYPNPTAVLLYVKIPAFVNSQPIVADLLDASGKLVAQPILVPGSNNAIAVGKLPAGLYTLRCYIQQQLFVVRFVKKG